MKRRHWLAAAAMLATIAFLPGCPLHRQSTPEVAAIPETGKIAGLSSDQARYAPGEPVRLHVQIHDAAQGGSVLVRYWSLSQPIAQETVKLVNGAADWSWTPPKDDDRGYLVETFLKQNGTFVDHATLGVDVSSDWGKFPRYGYLADFGEMTEADQARVMARLNRLHLNGIQFYDWQAKHHEPLGAPDGTLTEGWTDIANRPIRAQTVKRYIDEAHAYGMKAMSYNLLFGATRDYERDGARKEWGLFKDAEHNEQDRHPLPASWKSDIYLMDPGNEAWQRYLIEREKRAFAALPFDGYHVDQLGDRGAVFNYKGDMVDLPSAYRSFLTNAKQLLNVDYVMNAVNQYAQEEIAQSPVKFLYTEVWSNGFQDLKDVIDQNNGMSHHEKNTVIAAYMDYSLADGPGQFNPPGVLLTDAAIFAAGGAHLEAGENLLAKEYFPNRNLTVPDKLWQQLTRYYDFLVAYENLLRDGVTETQVRLEAVDGPALSEDPERGRIWSFAKTKGNRDILHMINLVDADSTDWKDAQGTQPEPTTLKNTTYRLILKNGQKVKAMWVATPDRFGGSPVVLPFKLKDGAIEFTVPQLDYWNMLVVENEK